MTHLLIKRLDTLAPLSDEERQALGEAAFRTIAIGADQDIVRQGEPLSECRILLDGFAARYKLLPEDQRHILAFGLPGDLLDLEGFVSGRMDHSVSALYPCTVAVVPHQALRDLVRDHPGIARALWRDTLVDAAVYREWVVNVGGRSASERIAHLLCEVFTRLQGAGLASEGGGEKAFAWPVTQSELGDATGLSTVHVNRTLQELRAEGLTAQRGSTMLIEEWAGLEQAGEFNSSYLHASAESGETSAPPDQRVERQARRVRMS